MFESNYGCSGKLFIKYVIENILQKGGEEQLRADLKKMKADLTAKLEKDFGDTFLDSIDYGFYKVEEVAVMALADYYASLSAFNIKDEAAAWSEAVNLGKQIMMAM